jgi:muramidase (phage lysozyme)
MAQITPEDAGGKAVVSFLDLIAFSEGTDTGLDNGYGVIVSGITGPHTFSEYSTHPFETRDPIVVRENPLLLSTASGRYQLLLRYWRSYKVTLNLLDFSPLSQDKIAIQQLKERGVLELLSNEDVVSAIDRASNLWASLPGNNYSQGGKTLDVLLEKWVQINGNQTMNLRS